jgi:Cytosine/adenosine deaminases
MSYKYQTVAFKESLKTNDTKQHFGCLVVKNNRIISRGHNFRSFGTSHTCCCHAEMDAIYRHMKVLGRWESFKSILKSSYYQVGTLTRITRKAI